MTTEDDLQRILDLHPEDGQTRLVLADFLEERGDPRAEGYRALGALRLYPISDNVGFFFVDNSRPYRIGRDNLVPTEWLSEIPERDRDGFWPEPATAATRREADDTLAISFLKLSAGRRAELLSAAHV